MIFAEDVMKQFTAAAWNNWPLVAWALPLSVTTATTNNTEIAIFRYHGNDHHFWRPGSGLQTNWNNSQCVSCLKAGVTFLEQSWNLQSLAFDKLHIGIVEQAEFCKIHTSRVMDVVDSRDVIVCTDLKYRLAIHKCTHLKFTSCVGAVQLYIIVTDVLMNTQKIVLFDSSTIFQVWWSLSLWKQRGRNQLYRFPFHYTSAQRTESGWGQHICLWSCCVDAGHFNCGCFRVSGPHNVGKLQEQQREGQVEVPVRHASQHASRHDILRQIGRDWSQETAAERTHRETGVLPLQQQTGFNDLHREPG